MADAALDAAVAETQKLLGALIQKVDTILFDTIRNLNFGDVSDVVTMVFVGLVECTKPKLTEPLLKKPPFRFLHDIISEVNRVKGFPGPSVLTEFDLDSNNFKDKDSKVLYHIFTIILR